MSNLDYIIIAFASAVTVLMVVECYSKISRDRLISLIFKDVAIILLAGVLVTLNTYTNGGYIRIIMNFSILFLTCLYIFKDNFLKTLYQILFCYLIMFFYEILLSVLLDLFFDDINTFDKNILFKTVFSIVSMGLSLITCYIKQVKDFSNKISLKITNNKTIVFMFIISFLIFMLIDFKYSLSFSSSVYIINFIIMTSVFILILLNVYNYFKINKEIEKTEVLLNFMSKYEKMIDDDRINRHEMLNNLLALKSFKKKNSDEYNQLLDELIETYNRKGIGIKNIYQLPSGIKGIFYYKLNGLEEKGYNINIKIAKNTNNFFNNISHKEYLSLYKIIGILLDNAIEAAELSKEKIINIEIYKEKDILNIIIDNTFKKKVDLNKINNKYYSTKGKNRGLGLFIVNKILKDSEKIRLEQVIENNIFSSRIQIKK